MNRDMLNNLILRLEKVLGRENVLANHDTLINYSHDEYPQTDIRNLPDIVVKPFTSQEISEIVRIANQLGVPVTPRGGGTGLCGGCVPVRGGIVVSSDHLNRVLEIDTENQVAVLQAGVTLAEFYQSIAHTNLFFPPHPGDESATIGGVIATNAGGARAVKYGVIRNYVRGLEVVLPDGEIINFGGKFIKNSTGYNLMHLLIGSEGTLGIITAATISLLPRPPYMYTLIVPFSSLFQAIAAVPAILQRGIVPMAIEFIDYTTLSVAGNYLQKAWPCTGGEAHLMIILDAAGEDEIIALADSIERICRTFDALDVFVADDTIKQKTILDIRSNIYEAMRLHLYEILDITVPRSRIVEYVNEVTNLAAAYNTWLPTYGHAADGNVHTHLMKSYWNNGVWVAIEDWEKNISEIRDRLHHLGKRLGGIVSGEHGIGMVKRRYIEDFLDKGQIRLMKLIKQCFDPTGICNPGKIFPD